MRACAEPENLLFRIVDAAHMGDVAFEPVLLVRMPGHQNAREVGDGHYRSVASGVFMQADKLSATQWLARK